MVWVILATLGLLAGSFINAVVWRVHEQAKSLKLKAKSKELGTRDLGLGTKNRELSIFSGRSQCPHCHHVLAWYDLVPLFSWLFLKGRCRYCKLSISVEYPLIELATATIFVISYAYWPGGVYGAADWLLLATWLLISVGLLALLIYDLKWMILPNKIIYPTLIVAVGGRLVYLISFETDLKRALIEWGLSVLVASGLFWLIFAASSGRWIGYGDVRLGLITGTVLADPILSLLMIFVASVLGTLVALPALAAGRKHLGSKLPFGPFLIIATALVLLFGSPVIDYYKRLLE